MRYLAVLVGCAIVLGMNALSTQAAGVDFTGAWKLNTAASDLGEGGGRRGMAPANLDVKQAEGKLVVESTRLNRDGQEMKMAMTYTLDGKECKNDGENRTSVATATWSEDGKSLTIKSKTTMSREGQSFTFDSVEVWSLDGGKLLIDSTVSSQQGERKSKRVYEKS